MLSLMMFYAVNDEIKCFKRKRKTFEIREKCYSQYFNLIQRPLLHHDRLTSVLREKCVVVRQKKLYRYIVCLVLTFFQYVLRCGIIIEKI